MIQTVALVWIASSLGGNPIALGSTARHALPGTEHTIVLAQAQTPNKQRTKQRRRTSRQPASSSGGSAQSPSETKGFDPKKIWESD